MVMRVLLIFLLLSGALFPANAGPIEVAGCGSQRIMPIATSDAGQVCLPWPASSEVGCSKKEIGTNAILHNSPRPEVERTGIEHDFVLVSDVPRGIDRPPKVFLI